MSIPKKAFSKTQEITRLVTEEQIIQPKPDLGASVHTENSETAAHHILESSL